jgi:hypothetical protein
VQETHVINVIAATPRDIKVMKMTERPQNQREDSAEQA